MGGDQSKMVKKPPPPKPKKPRVKRPTIVDYFPNVKRKRPKSAHSWTEVQLVTTLGKQGRSATFDTFESQSTLNQTHTIPRWQSKWEIDMRPEAQSENTPPLKTWQSMPLPTTDIFVTSHDTPVQRLPLDKPKKGKRREKRAELGRGGLSPLPDVDEVDNFERTSVSSMREDKYKMIYNTDDRSNNYLDMTAKLWHFEPKKANKLWFLGQDPQLKNEVETVPKQAKPGPRVKTISRLRGHNRKPIQSKLMNALKLRPKIETKH